MRDPMSTCSVRAERRAAPKPARVPTGDRPTYSSDQGPSFTLAGRTHKMNPSVIREILKVTERPGIISFAGGLPSPQTFPVEAMREACTKVLRDTPREALQYSASEGYGPLAEWLASELVQQGLHVEPSQVLITTGSQQGLDLVGKVLIDAGSKVLVESPTYLGALQAFAPMEPSFIGVPGDDEAGPNVEALATLAPGARFSTCCRTSRTRPVARSAKRGAPPLPRCALALNLPLVEDNPYGELWFDAPPAPCLAARHPHGSIYLGSFSKVLAPGLRLGYLVAPQALMPKLLQAKQAADLHTPSFNQRVVYEVIRNGFLHEHVPTIRSLYKTQRDTMLAALARHMPNGVSWNEPAGGMFLWVRLPAALKAADLLPQAVARGVAFVPGAPFYAGEPDHQTLRLSFVTATAEQIDTGIATLARVVGEAIDAGRA